MRCKDLRREETRLKHDLGKKKGTKFERTRRTDAANCTHLVVRGDQSGTLRGTEGTADDTGTLREGHIVIHLDQQNRRQLSLQPAEKHLQVTKYRF